MLLTFYNMKDENNVINKEKEKISEINIRLKHNDSILEPLIIITRNNFPINCNYCHIDVLNRYYFINSKKEISNNLIELHLEVDELETYKDEILNADSIITMKSTPSYFNGSVAIDSRSEIETYYSNIELENTNTILLSTIGGGE